MPSPQSRERLAWCKKVFHVCCQTDGPNPPFLSRIPHLRPRSFSSRVRARHLAENIAEAMTAMSSFRIGQLRLQRVVSRLYERARFG